MVFELTLDLDPLPNFGFSSLNTGTVLPHSLRISTDVLTARCSIHRLKIRSPPACCGLPLRRAAPVTRPSSAARSRCRASALACFSM
jgi:hypothetical protein